LLNPSKIDQTSEVSKSGSKTFDYDDGKIKVGVCCMEKKLKSKPMQAILSYMAQYNDLVID
jgi:hypothetical protein